MELICKDDSYTTDVLEFWSKNGVKHPIKGNMYTVRDMITHSNGKVGIRVEEIKNPEVLVKHPILGHSKMEPSFDLKRFTNLSGNTLSKEDIKEMIKTCKNIDLNIT